MSVRPLPALEVNLDAMRTNAQVLCGVCAQYGIQVADVIKFSDGDLEVARAYAEGGCAQLAVSRAKHLKALALPHKETLLTRSPTRSDLEDVGGSSDHTIVDVTDTGKTWRSGDTLTFKVKYSPMLYAFTGDHVNIEYSTDP